MEPRELGLRMTGFVQDMAQTSDMEESGQLIKRAMAGDSAAFDQIILRYQRRVLMTSWRLLGSREDAQDAAQEVFLRLYRHMRRFDEKRELLPWLYRLTVNVCHDLRRKLRLDAGVAFEEANHPGTEVDPAGEITRIEQRRIIEEALKTLTEKEQAAVVLRDIEGLSTKDVARILGSSETTIRSQISSARVKIRKFVDRLEKRRP